MTLTLEELRGDLDRCRQEVGKVIIGQEAVVDQALICVLVGAHGLIEGVPGVAKTLLVRSLAAVCGGSFERIQFTPDLMPADITGVNVFDPSTRSFELLRGPIFTDFLLGDEINRAPAKTQSALLQAMQERSVTIDRETYALSSSFTVFATQNPVEYEGVYPLPEAQLDRFMLKIEMHPPEREDEILLADKMLGKDAPEAVLASGSVDAVLTPDRMVELRGALQAIDVRAEIRQYVVDLVRHTRQHDAILVGGGPRATQALLLSARGHAAVDGRDFVTPDDVRSMAVPAVAHRLVVRPEYEIEGVSLTEVVERVLREVPVPR